MINSIRSAGQAPDRSGTDCQTLTEADREQLWDAANRFVDAQGIAVRLTALLSRTVTGLAGRLDDVGHRMFGPAWDGVEAKVQTTVEDVLWRTHDLATWGSARGQIARHRPGCTGCPPPPVAPCPGSPVCPDCCSTSRSPPR